MKPEEDTMTLFGDLTRKVTVFRWGRTIMVEVVSEDDDRAVVQYGVDPDTNVPVLMEVSKTKDAYRRLTPQEARDILTEAVKFAARLSHSKRKEPQLEPAAGKHS